MAMKDPTVYAAALAAASGNPAGATFFVQLMTQVQQMIKDGDVTPTALVAPTGGGPVTGTGKVE